MEEERSFLKSHRGDSIAMRPTLLIAITLGIFLVGAQPSRAQLPPSLPPPTKAPGEQPTKPPADAATPAPTRSAAPTRTPAQGSPGQPNTPPTPTPIPGPTRRPPGIQIISISPAAENVTPQFPASPPGQSAFYFRGKKGTTYTAVFDLAASPAVVVGVGADINSTSYDAEKREFTVVFNYDQAVLSPDGKTFPADTFFINIDPGAKRDFNPPPPRDPNGPPPGREGATDGPVKPRDLKVRSVDTTECYGPLGDNTDSDIRPGPPLEAAGSFMSTNLTDWCIVPPSSTQPFYGFKLRGPAGAKGFLKKKVSPSLVTLLSLLSGRSLATTDFGIFNGDVQASRSISPTSDGGLLISINVTFGATSTIVADAASPSSSRSRASNAKSGPVRSKADSNVDKTITASEAEPLSLAPKDFSISGTTASLYGFVTDSDELVGEKVLLQRKVGTKLITVGTAKIAADGSYTKRINTSKFTSSTTKGKATASATTFSKATLIATLISSAIRTSREITLQYKARNARR